MRAGIPFKHSFKATATFEGFNNNDRYINGEVFTSTDKLDVLQLKGIQNWPELAAFDYDAKPGTGAVCFGLPGY